MPVTPSTSTDRRCAATADRALALLVDGTLRAWNFGASAM
jgi:hypothetical protein